MPNVHFLPVDDVSASSNAYTTRVSLAPKGKTNKVGAGDKDEGAQTPADPVPVASLGTSVCILKKVVRWHDSRQIRAEIIEPYTSATEKLLHWRTVAHLHKSSYSLPAPFIIPPPSSKSNITPLEPQSTSHAFPALGAKRLRSMNASSVPSSAHTSPSQTPKSTPVITLPISASQEKEDLGYVSDPPAT
ncbi:hypothetical protein FIBSPDRAFT_942851 [Athelia psychrophila]|uniref:Uncharacterized protein n=1 Tax=Athelia psychrophila TaxID=1759441 RepID=A0A166WFS4_9AGAM|nr:hypothetical protein FIBSPDRAFT_942851 [Fibularhizoctonia sp. CBS 109695]